jgi:amidase
MVKPPTAKQLEEIARGYNLHLDEDEARSFRGLMEGTLGSYRRLDQLVEPELPVRHSRSGSRRPEPEENRLNAWYRKCSIKGATEGPLSGKRVAIKDNVCVAGLPMMNGSSTLEGYVPEFDATIVTRILDAGGEIVGKAVCEHLCFSGGSHTSDTGPVLNPHNHGRSAGGSSSGSAALVAAGECEMAIGGDQGGSIRIPSSWCGVYGLKPTYGLVPYTGVFPIELTLDHTGPIAGSVLDVALLLEAIAGEDGLDPRQKGVRTGDYRGSLDGGVQGLRIGVVSEGFGWPDLSEEDVDETVRTSARLFEDLGAEVSEISVPLHHDGLHIWNGIAIEGATELMVRGNGMGTNWKGHYITSLLDAYAPGRTTRADDLSERGQAHLALGSVHAGQLPWPLLRQSSEPGPQARISIRRRPGFCGLAGDADPPDEGHAPARSLFSPRRGRGARSGDDPQHRPVRRQRTSRDDGALRLFGWPPCWYDACWEEVGRGNCAPGRPRLRADRDLHCPTGRCSERLTKAKATNPRRQACHVREQRARTLLGGTREVQPQGCRLRRLRCSVKREHHSTRSQA